jgi:hypothetical protein
MFPLWPQTDMPAEFQVEIEKKERHFKDKKSLL